MSNHHLRDRRLSLKAKGLLSQMLSLPESWDYTIEGLCYINKENSTAIKSALRELKEQGYLVVTKMMPNDTESGRIEYQYDIYEKPHLEKQGVENLPLENQPQINTNKQNKENKIKKHIYGEYKHVRLTDDEYGKLQTTFGNADELIKYLDEAKEEKGYKYNSDYMAIRRWVVEAVKRDKAKRSNGGWQRKGDVFPAYYNADPNRKSDDEKMTAKETADLRKLLQGGRNG